MSRGLTLGSILELHEHRPEGNRLVLYVNKTLWRVEEVSMVTCKLRRMSGVSVTGEIWDTSNPNATGYWYFPENPISYPQLSDSLSEDDI